jgi:hypothetical protein
VPGSGAKIASESNRGKRRQSIELAVPTGAAV